MKEILLATTNMGKVKELQALLEQEQVRILSLKDFPDFPEIEETGSTFEENALIKAREACRLAGRITLADDSGLEVDALEGAPGIYSARYGGEPKDDERNIEKLLQALKDVPAGERSARFRCALAIVTPAGEEKQTEGAVEGEILMSKKGSGGFGYDPVFYLPQKGLTMAEVSMADKNSLSHRAQAFQKAVPILRALL